MASAIRNDEALITAEQRSHPCAAGGMTIRHLAWVVAALAVAGCGSQTGASPRATTRAHAGRPYRLYTHCGIQWAEIDGTYWRAKHPLSDGSGNPPSGWGNPFEEGTLVLVTPSAARFDSPAGSVTFERTSRTQPPLICS